MRAKIMKMINEIVTLPDSCSNSLSLSGFRLGFVCSVTCSTPQLKPQKQQSGNVQRLSCKKPTGNRQVLGGSVRSFTGSHREVTQVPADHFHICQRCVPSVPGCNYPTCHRTGLEKVVKESQLHTGVPGERPDLIISVVLLVFLSTFTLPPRLKYSS